MIEANGRFIGRGTCDMKGSVALAMNALIEASAKSLKHPLVVLLSYDEEVGSLGAARTAEKWGSREPLPPNVVIGEPTSLKAVRMHKGHLKLKVTIKGKAAHSGTPQLGVNAIELATRVLERLVKLKDQLETEHCETSKFFPDVPFVALNIARITGGDAINVVPDRCVIDLGVRPLPGVESQPLIERVQDAVTKAHVPAESLKFEVVNDSPPMLLREDAPVYRTLREMLSQKQSLGVSFSTDGGVLTRRMGLECVLFGPGSMATAHQANESLPIAEFERAAPILRRLVQRLCME
jgi:acetylornithine deacetylase